METEPVETNEAQSGQQPAGEDPCAEGTHEILSIGEIIIDAGTQVRAQIDEAIVEEYAEHLAAGGTLPPVTAFRDGGSTYLADGFHRLRAHQRAERTEIEAQVQTGTREDALWCALGANRAHGHRLTSADKKHAIELALEVWPDRSQRRIAAQIGCSQRYVGKVRAQVRTSSHLPDRTVGSDGKSYPAGGNTPQLEPREPDDETPEGTEVSSMPAFAEPGSVHHGTGETDSGEASAMPASAEPRSVHNGTGKAESGARPSQRAQTRSNRIVSVVATDALNLTAQENLIDFRALDRGKLPEWIGELEEARRRIGRLIRRLKREVGDENGNDEAGIEDPSGSD